MNFVCGHYAGDNYNATLHVPYSFIATLRHGDATPKVIFDPTELAKAVLELRENRGLIRAAINNGSIAEVFVSSARVGRISDLLQAGEELPAMLEASEEFWLQKREVADSCQGDDEDEV